MFQLFIRSCAEYCSVVFDCSLTKSQSKVLERLQSTCHKVILQDNYISYSAVLEMTGRETLWDRREKKCLDFSIKCIKHPQNYWFFPLNPNLKNQTEICEREIFYVNYARTEDYKNSAIPYCQRLLNLHYENLELPSNINSI